MLRGLLIACAATIIAYAQTTTTTTLTVSANATVGRPVTLTANVAPATSGVVEFTDDFEILGTAQLGSNSQAALQYIFRHAGALSIASRFSRKSDLCGEPDSHPGDTYRIAAGSLFGPAQPYTPAPVPPVFDTNLDGRADEFISSVIFRTGSNMSPQSPLNMEIRPEI